MAKPTEAESVKEIERAEKALETARAKHRAEFRKEIARVFNEYGLALTHNGFAGGALVIETLGPRGEYEVASLPE